MQMWFLTNHFPKKNESVQYNTALAITGAIKGSSREKLYEELAQEYLYRSRWTRRLCLLYKVFSTGQPSYIYDLLPPLRSSRRHVNSFNLVTCKSEYFKNSFIPNVIYEWNKLDPDIRSSASYNLFRNILLKFIRAVPNKTFNINDSVEGKLLTKLCLSLDMVSKGAAPGTVGTVSTVPDFFDQNEFFYHFIQNMKMSFVFHIKF